ncbi:hypothetical protein [Spirosoma jeollabukense]
MAKKVNLPPLPDNKPSGSILAYLEQVRQKREDNPSENERITNSTEKSAIPEKSHLMTMTTNQLSTELEPENNSPMADKVEKNQTESTVQHPPTAEGMFDDIPKILDKSESLEVGVTEEEKITSGSANLLTSSSNENGNGAKKKVKGVNKPTESLLVDYLNNLPIEFTTYSFTKGEMKVRVSEDMAYFLKLLSESCPEAKAIRYLSENLINRLLWQFFQTYGAEIEALHQEVERQRLMNHTRRMGSLKNN